jgi:hypothetical protein
VKDTPSYQFNQNRQKARGSYTAQKYGNEKILRVVVGKYSNQGKANSHQTESNFPNGFLPG